MLLSVFLQLSNHWFPFWGSNWEALGHEGGCMGIQGMAVAAKKEDCACSARQVNFHAEQIRFRFLLAVGEAII